MKITFITTEDYNVGDDFVREGIKFLLSTYFGNKNIEFINIHKHSPITARDGFEKIRNPRLSKILDPIIPFKKDSDKIYNSDLIVQSGAPVYWCHDGGGHCSKNEWYKPLIKKRFLKYKKDINLINIAAGTCQPFHSNGDEFCNDCHDYIKEFNALCKITTLRDQLSKKLFDKNNINGQVIPCSSIFAVDYHDIQPMNGEYVAMNYMKGGAHYTLGQEIDQKRWEDEFKSFYFDLKKEERVIIACHNKKELNDVKNFDPKAEVFFSENNYVDYMKFYSKSKFGFMNRVHGSFIMASLGKPSIGIGNDSRVRMLDEIGLKYYFVNDVGYENLMMDYKDLKLNHLEYFNLFKDIKNKALQDYLKVFSDYL